MPLKIKLASLDQSQDAKTNSIKEGTGAYNSTSNPGGYGTPNPAVADIISAVLLVYPPKSTTPSYLLLDNSSTPAVLDFIDPFVQEPLSFNSETLGLTAVGEPLQALKSGTWEINYMVILETFGATLTNGSKEVTGLTDASAVFNAYTHIYAGGGIYMIDKSATPGVNNLFLTQPYTGTSGSLTAGGGFASINKFAVSQDVDNKIASMIGRLNPHVCSDEVFELQKAVLYKFGIDACGECSNYKGAQDNADALYSYLDTQSSCQC